MIRRSKVAVTNLITTWHSKGLLLKSINRKNKLYKLYINRPTENNLQKFKTYKNKLNMLIRKSKRSYYFNKFEDSKSNMRETWKEINCIIGKGKKQSTSCKFKDGCGNIISNPQNISEKFNDFFVNVGPNLASTIHNTGKQYYDYLQDVNSECMYMKPIIEMDVIKIIDKFSPNKSAGLDGIGNYIIKNVSKEIVAPLTQIFNLSLTTGIVPDKLKIAKVVPIYKKR